MPRECWTPSRGLRAVMAVRAVADAGLCYLIMRFLFPSVLLVPVTAVAALPVFSTCFARYRVRLDRAAGQVAITAGFWTRRVPLTRIRRVDDVRRFTVEVRMTDGSYSFTPFRRRRRPELWLRIRTGFEGMEPAITEARAAGPAGPAAEHTGAWRKIATAGVACVMGLFPAAAAALVRPRAGGWVVHAAALLLRTWLIIGAVAAVLIAAGILVSAWHDWRMAANTRHTPSNT